MSPTFLIVDLFCGFGGTTTGFVLSGTAKVIACVNHDPKAIKSHWLNHPEVKHFEEDIRTLDLTELVALVDIYRKMYPKAKMVLWASLECTNFSKAKGGQPRNADSRTLADHLDRYILALDPDYVKIENVVEFMSWGPLDENGKPVSRKSGSDWMKWRERINGIGYRDEWCEMNSANFGAYTSRNRLFGVFAKEGLPIVWPSPTHSKNPNNGLFGNLEKWKPVKDVLNFSDEGESIFQRNKALSDKTLERIYAGLIKYVAKGDISFLSKYFSGAPSDKNISVEGPAGTVTCTDHHSLVKVSFIQQRNSGDPKSKVSSIENPARTLTATGGNQELVQAEFLQHYYGNGFSTSRDEPCPTLTTKERVALVQPEYLINYNHSSNCNDLNEPSPTLLTRDKLGFVKPVYFLKRDFNSKHNHSSVETVAGSVMPNPKLDLIEATPFVVNQNYSNGPQAIEEPLGTITANRKWHYIINPSWGGHPSGVDEPCVVLIARQDKAPLYLTMTEIGDVAIAVYEHDTPISIKIKEFMAIYGLVDIKMRMLRVPELLKIQGFPDNYQMVGNQSDQKKFIGNSVVPHVVKAWALAMHEKINQPAYVRN